MNCPVCGAAITSQYTYCPRCDAPLPAPGTGWSTARIVLITGGAVVLLLVVVAAAFLVITTGRARYSAVYTQALARAFVSGRARAVGAAGQDEWPQPGAVFEDPLYAQASIRVFGPKGNGHIYAVARGSGQELSFRRLVVWVDGGRRVDLSDPVKPDPSRLPSSIGGTVYLVPFAG